MAHLFPMTHARLRRALLFALLLSAGTARAQDVEDYLRPACLGYHGLRDAFAKELRMRGDSQASRAGLEKAEADYRACIARTPPVMSEQEARARQKQKQEVEMTEALERAGRPPVGAIAPLPPPEAPAVRSLRQSQRARRLAQSAWICWYRQGIDSPNEMIAPTSRTGLASLNQKMIEAQLRPLACSGRKVKSLVRCLQADSDGGPLPEACQKPLPLLTLDWFHSR